MFNSSLLPSYVPDCLCQFQLLSNHDWEDTHTKFILKFVSRLGEHQHIETSDLGEPGSQLDSVKKFELESKANGKAVP